MAGAVIAAIVLTLLLPEQDRLGPTWLLPLLEAVLLVALIIADAAEISNRSRELRALSIGLVAVLVFRRARSSGCRTTSRSRFCTGSSTAAARQAGRMAFRPTSTSHFRSR
jgi:hypothetical protein